MSNNLLKVHTLIQNRPWADDILQQIEALIELEPNIAFKHMMGMSMSAVMMELEENNRNK